MTINLPQNLDFLLDQSWIEDFLKKNSEEIFGQKLNIVVTRIERSKSFAPEVYNMIYDLMMDDKSQILRASSSTLKERETTFKVMDFIYNNGFSDGSFLVPQALKFFPELNLMFYIDLDGFMMKDFINEDKNSFAEKVRGAGEALKQFHTLPIPNFSLPEMDWNIDCEKISKYAPDLIDMLGNRLSKVLEKSKNRVNFVHGDYQLKNIILGEHLGIIDFGSSTLAEKELDIACFVTQLEIMLKRYADISNFEYLKQVFLAGYGDFDLSIYETYDYLYRFQILQALIVIYYQDSNANQKEIMDAIDYWIKIIKEKYNGDSK